MKRWIAALAALMMLWILPAAGEGTPMTETEWYRQALKDAGMSLGNNARLKNVIERARNGEHITIGTIGGSITEGAGAGNYSECWASRLAVRFGNAFGTNNGSNVHLVNAGVGGTPSTFGLMRYEREIVGRVPEEDPDGLPDVVVIELSVNDWGEPTGHRCYESLVKTALDAPNEPAVILLFAVFRNGFNLQEDLRKIGDRYGLMMVSIKDGIFSHIGSELTAEEFFFDEYHPTSLGHRIMSDCLMQAITDAAEKETDAAPEADAAPVYGTDFVGLKTIFGDSEADGYTIERGGFSQTDIKSYWNKPVGWVCGTNFFHEANYPEDPLKVTGTFRKCLVAWKASNDPAFGAAEIWVDGKMKMMVQGAQDKWGQSEVVLALDEAEAAEHTIEIRVKDRTRKFTVTAIGIQ